MLQLSFIVVESSVQMSWIDDHWSKGYISMAKNIILDFISIDALVLTSTVYPNQMQQYHSCLPQESPSETQHCTLEDFNAIITRLHIKDMGGHKNTQHVIHTVEDEYRSYTKGNLTNLGEDPL